MVNDHLSDLITRIRNGYIARRKEITVPETKMVRAVAEVLAETGYLTGVEKTDRNLKLVLKYQADGEPVILGIRRVSRPGGRVYCEVKNLPRIWGGIGVNILSTPKGVMADKKAKKLRAGGEILAQVW